MRQIQWRRLLLIVLAALALVLAGGLVYWTRTTRLPTEAALQALQSDVQVEVTSEPGFTIFAPVGGAPATGFILYPGGGVDARAYAPTLRQIAAQGYLAAVVTVPLNLAFFDVDAADEVMAAYPQIAHWVVGGHSLGGVAAASYATAHPELGGLALWASYPGNDALRETSLAVVSIYGSEDGLTTLTDIDASRPQLPPQTRFVEIAGGNHAQFGAYGPQQGDRPATLSPAAQWDQIVAATVALLAPIAG